MFVSNSPENPRGSEQERRRREPAALSVRVTSQLATYVAAAGVSMLTCAPAAQAETIYTKTNTTLYFRTLSIDVNNDGILDFTFEPVSLLRTGQERRRPKCLWAARQCRPFFLPWRRCTARRRSDRAGR